MTDGVALKSVQGTVRILRIAADIALAPVIASLLIRRGYDVKSFTNSQEALLELQQHPESDNIILNEHNIPQMTGLELAREVRALRQDVPVVLRQTPPSFTHPDSSEGIARTTIMSLLNVSRIILPFFVHI